MLVRFFFFPNGMKIIMLKDTDLILLVGKPFFKTTQQKCPAFKLLKGLQRAAVTFDYVYLQVAFCINSHRSGLL